jgi:hypothetical protein
MYEYIGSQVVLVEWRSSVERHEEPQKNQRSVFQTYHWPSSCTRFDNLEKQQTLGYRGGSYCGPFHAVTIFKTDVDVQGQLAYAGNKDPCHLPPDPAKA